MDDALAQPNSAHEHPEPIGLHYDECGLLLNKILWTIFIFQVSHSVIPAGHMARPIILTL